MFAGRLSTACEISGVTGATPSPLPVGGGGVTTVSTPAVSPRFCPAAVVPLSDGPDPPLHAASDRASTPPRTIVLQGRIERRNLDIALAAHCRQTARQCVYWETGRQFQHPNFHAAMTDSATKTGLFAKPIRKRQSSKAKRQAKNRFELHGEENDGAPASWCLPNLQAARRVSLALRRSRSAPAPSASARISLAWSGRCRSRPQLPCRRLRHRSSRSRQRDRSGSGSCSP
jgi:hypothetical protein